MRDRRRSVLRRTGRRRGSLVFIAVLVVAAGVLFVWLRSSDVFAVRRISVTATGHVTSDQIAKATSSAFGRSLLSLSTKPIEDALTAIPYVRSAEVYRDFPNTLEVQVVEYQPAARLRAGNGELWLVSVDGRVLGNQASGNGTGASVGGSLPLVVPSIPVNPAAGDQLPSDLTEALPVVPLLGTNGAGVSGQTGLPAVKEVHVSAAGEIVLTLAGGVELRMGDPTQLERKLTEASAIIQQCLRDQKPVEYVDVSVPGRTAVKAK